MVNNIENYISNISEEEEISLFYVLLCSESPPLAMAFRYDSRTDNCPIVIAKALDSEIKTIKKSALYYNIPVIKHQAMIENLKHLDIEDEIPHCYWNEFAMIFKSSLQNEFDKHGNQYKITNKYRFIRNLIALSGEEKQNTTKFFSKHPNYENLIDWNNKNLTYKDFEDIFILTGKSNTIHDKLIKKDPVYLFADKNCKIIDQTDDYLIAVPLDWKGAVYFNSCLCGGEGAKWCISRKNDKKHWNWYFENGFTFYLIYFFKRHPSLGKKAIIEYNSEYNYFSLWLQDNTNGWDILSTLPGRLTELNKNNPFNVSMRLWYYHLQSDKKRNGQLYFDFNIPESLEVINEEIPDATYIKNIVSLLIHDEITFSKIKDDVYYDNTIEFQFE